MSERLDSLAQRLAEMCEGMPVDVTQTEPTLVLMAKCQAQALAEAFRAAGTPQKRQEAVDGTLKFAAELAKTLGDKHRVVKIIRGMHLIAAAILNGTPEPTDEDLGLTSKCFIATACYDSPDCVEVQRLREFRDRVLLGSRSGRLCVAIYYRVSPPLAAWLAANPRCKTFVREYLIAPIANQIAAPCTRDSRRQ